MAKTPKFWPGPANKYGHVTIADEDELRAELLDMVSPLHPNREDARLNSYRAAITRGEVPPEFVRADERAAELRRASDIGHGFENIADALSGNRPDHSFSDRLRADADDLAQEPMRQLSVSAAFERLNKGDDKAQADLDDPHSPVSLTARRLVRGMLGDSAARLGPEFEQVPASRLKSMGLDIDKLLKTDPGLGRMQANIDRTDPTSPASVAAREAFKQVASIYNPKFYQSYADTLPNMSAATIEDRLYGLMGADEKRAFDDMRREKEAAAKAEAQKRKELERQAKLTAATAKAQDKAAQKNAEFFVDGFELRPDARPRPTEVSGLRSATAFNATLRDTVNEIRKLYDQYGTEALPTEAKARMAALARDLQLGAKGEELYKLGVLTGPDLALLEELVPNPAAGRSNVLAILGGSDQTLAKLETLVHQADTRLRNRAKSLGYTPKGVSTPRSQPTAKVKMTNGSETMLVHPGDVAEAESEGFRRVR